MTPTTVRGVVVPAAEASRCSDYRGNDQGKVVLDLLRVAWSSKLREACDGGERAQIQVWKNGEDERREMAREVGGGERGRGEKKSEPK